jgi:hypothetical protein
VLENTTVTHPNITFAEVNKVLMKIMYHNAGEELLKEIATKKTNFEGIESIKGDRGITGPTGVQGEKGESDIIVVIEKPYYDVSDSAKTKIQIAKDLETPIWKLPAQEGDQE